MKKRTVVTAIVLLTLASVGISFGQVDFLINARPASILIDSSGGKFSVEGPDGRMSLSQVYAMPNISLGAGIEISDFYIDITGGGGVVINDAFRSFLLQASVAVNYTLSESLIAGPRLGMVYFPSPDWTENDYLDIEESWGLLAGLQLSMGDKIQYLVSVDLIDVTYDIDLSSGILGEDEMDVTGIAFQFGVRGEF